MFVAPAGLEFLKAKVSRHAPQCFNFYVQNIFKKNLAKDSQSLEHL